MAWVVKLLINYKVMFIIGIILSIVIKLSNSKINIPDSFGMGVIVLLMFSFMTSFIFEGLFNYKS